MWGLVRKYRGRGFATEAAARARDFAYGTLRWVTVVSYIAPENAASRKVAERLGATHEGKAQLKTTTADVWRHPSPKH
jgi:ribosomal-protein-alanine N-acetyltransferase